MHRRVSESIVRLVVSDGPAPVVVDDVGGKTYDEAAQILAGIAVHGRARCRRVQLDRRPQAR